MAIVKEERIGPHRLILGDCLDVMRTLDPVDMVLTSPPYDNLRDYNDALNRVDTLAVITEISKIIKQGGVCMWNVADATIRGSETGTSFRQALHAMECGLNLHDTMIYIKDFVNFPESNRYFSCCEYMFIFSNGSPKTFNPIIDRVNKWHGSTIRGTYRQKDGTLRQAHGKGKKVRKNGMRFNWWLMKNNTTYCGDHPAPMPYTMADGQIRSWSNPAETILDPFMGSGTTLVACQRLGRSGIGIEIDPEYFAIACKRVDEAMRQPDLFVETPKAPEQTGMDI